MELILNDTGNRQTGLVIVHVDCHLIVVLQKTIFAKYLIQILKWLSLIRVLMHYKLQLCFHGFCILHNESLQLHLGALSLFLCALLCVRQLFNCCKSLKKHFVNNSWIKQHSIYISMALSQCSFNIELLKFYVSHDSNNFDEFRLKRQQTGAPGTARHQIHSGNENYPGVK